MTPDRWRREVEVRDDAADTARGELVFGYGMASHRGPTP